MRRIVLSGVLLAAVVAGLFYYLRTTTWYPVVRLAAPEGYTLTVVQTPVASMEHCETANRTFMAPVQKSCPQCRFEAPRCEGSLSGAEERLLSGEPLADYSVSGAGVRMLLTGPESITRPACGQIALEIAHNGVQYAACVYPGNRR